MPKRKKEDADELDLELLSALYYLEQATATDLEKELASVLSKAGISKRLKWLVEKGYLEEPEIDISTDKLKKIYKAPSKDKLKAIFLRYFLRQFEGDSYEIHEIEEFITDSEHPLHEFYKNIITRTLSSIPATTLRLLTKGVNIKDAVKILTSVSSNPYSELFSWELSGLINTEEKIVKITEKGLKAILNVWIPEIKEKLKDIKRFDFEVYKKLLTEFCRELP
jgi:DNA-binding Lrp family transcriptional regulator